MTEICKKGRTIGCLITLLTACTTVVMAQGKVGINTNTPQAMLHVKDSSVLFSSKPINFVAGAPPISGAGTRMMWYADKATFLAGEVTGSEWNKDSVGFHSAAFGLNTKAMGNGSFAAGTYSVASGGTSVALGNGNIASGPSAVALGSGSRASGFESVAIGVESIAEFDNTVAIGYRCKASLPNSVAIGNQSNAINEFSIAMGTYALAAGFGSSIIGVESQATGDFSTVLGYRNRGKSFSSITIGQFNDSITSSSRTEWVITDPLFTIGNGTSENTRRNAFIITKNAKTGINVSNGLPQAMLHIKAAEATNDRHIRLEAFNSTNSGNIFYNNDLNFRNNTAGGDFFFINSASTAVLSLFSTGNMTITGTLTQNSDARLKKNIAPLDNSLEKILQVGGYHYQWNEDYRDQSLQTGLLAQQVETAMPELVSTSAEGVKSVNYSGMIPYLVEAMKELSAELQAQKASNKKLQEEVERLKKK